MPRVPVNYKQENTIKSHEDKLFQYIMVFSSSCRSLFLPPLRSFEKASSSNQILIHTIRIFLVNERPWGNVERSVMQLAERLKEEFGGRTAMVRGPSNMMMHLMFGVVALFADQLIRSTGY